MDAEITETLTHALARLHISKTRLSKALAITRPTLNKYIEIYDYGDRSLLDKDIRGIFLHLTNYCEIQDVDYYLNSVRIRRVLEERRLSRKVSQSIVVDGLTSPLEVLPATISQAEYDELRSKLDYKDTVSLMKALIASTCSDMTAKHFGTDLPAPGTSYYDNDEWPVDHYQVFFFLSIISELMDDPLINNSGFRDINRLKAYTDFGLSCTLFPVETASDRMPRFNIEELMREVGYSRPDTESKWYFGVYLHPHRKYLPSSMEMVTDYFQAKDLEDAYQKALFIDERDSLGVRSMGIVLFGPFGDLPEAD